MFRLTRAFIIAAAVSSTAMGAPVPQDVDKPISTGQSAGPSTPASGVFGTTTQNPNYQSHPTGLCIVPAFAKDAGLSQGQEQLTAQQAIQLCSEASTIAVSSKNSKRSPSVPNDAHLAPVPSPIPEIHPDAPHPARSVSQHPQTADVSPINKPIDEPHPGAPRPPVARDFPPQHTPVPQPTPEPLQDAPQPHVARDLPLQPEPVPSPSPVPQADHNAPHQIAARDTKQPPKGGIPPQPSPEPQPGTPHPAAPRSVPNAEVPSHPQPLPATIPRPSLR